MLIEYHEEKEQLNDNLLCELQKYENYISILKVMNYILII